MNFNNTLYESCLHSFCSPCSQPHVAPLSSCHKQTCKRDREKQGEREKEKEKEKEKERQRERGRERERERKREREREKEKERERERGRERDRERVFLCCSLRRIQPINLGPTQASTHLTREVPLACGRQFTDPRAIKLNSSSKYPDNSKHCK